MRGYIKRDTEICREIEVGLIIQTLPDIGHKGPFDHPERGGRVFIQAYYAAVLEFKDRPFDGSCY